tara:strand:+ start:4006 stop:4356 length:351 start_codon:yes stop_codon:yes gene_type:complete
MEDGSFLFKDSEDGEICLLIFMKLNKQQMDVALPNNKGEYNGEYFLGIFRQGIDYLGATEYSGIEQLMKAETLYNINELSYTQVLIDELEEEEYTKYKTFADKHMKTLKDIKEKVG